MQSLPLRIVSTKGVKINDGPTFRTYPYTPILWYDQAGYLRWTLTISQSVVLSAFLGMLVVYAVGCLLQILYIILYISFLERNRKTLVDDQVLTIGTNAADDPLKLIRFLLKFALITPRRVFSSRVFQVLFLIGAIFFGGQTVIMFFLGGLILNDPLPTSPGTCGLPLYGNATDNLVNSTGAPLQIAREFVDVHLTNLLAQAAIQFENCTDSGTAISCPGSVGQTFSWTVVESEPEYCWFGPEYCFNGSHTITQRATVVPSDFGTLRKSPMSVTVSVECSHLNTSQFENKDGWDPDLEQQFRRLPVGSEPSTGTSLSLGRGHHSHLFSRGSLGAELSPGL